MTLPDSAAAADSGARRHAPSAARNLAPISGVLAQALPGTGRALEIASGTGQHVAGFARQFPAITWQPSDANPENLASIAAWVQGLPNVGEPVVLNACTPGWADRLGGWDAVCLSNLLHLISSPEAVALLREVSRALVVGGVFCLYGPFKRDGALVSATDVAFDASLRQQDPEIGYKDSTWVIEQMQACGLAVTEVAAMPADNLMLIARRMA